MVWSVEITVCWFSGFVGVVIVGGFGCSGELSVHVVLTGGRGVWGASRLLDLRRVMASVPRQRMAQQFEEDYAGVLDVSQPQLVLCLVPGYSHLRHLF